MYYKVTNGAVEIKGKTILEEINMEIKENDKIAIVGRNGAGKTTLLKALIDNTYFSEGINEVKLEIFKSGIECLGYLEQNSLENSNKTLEEEILEVYMPLVNLEKKIAKLEKEMENGNGVLEYTELLEKYQLLGGYTYKKEFELALKKFGFKEQDKIKKIDSFSGGEKTKISFLKLLLSKPDLLLLDEPTNHLDLEAILWLENYLKNYSKTLVMISHDRMFMNKVCNKIYEIEYGKLEFYPGNYDFYEVEKVKRYLKALKDYEYQEKEIARLQRIVDRFRYKPSKAGMAMAKLKQIERIKRVVKPGPADTNIFNLKNMAFSPSGVEVLMVKDLIFGYDKALGIVNFSLTKKERLAIIGENGRGKSTLLKTIVGFVPKLGGSVELGAKVTIGYFAQQFETIHENKTIYEEFRDSYKELNDFGIRSFLASFMFFEDDLNKKIAVLSGGEKVRLELCKIIYKNPNFLILDEPTNHLDIMAKIKLEEILQNYQGTILFVSHDRYFVSKIATSLLVFKNNEVNYYGMNYNDYMAKKWDLEEIKETKKEKIIKKEKTNKDLLKQVKKLERDITKVEEEIKELQNSLFLEEVYSDYEKTNLIKDKIGNLNKELDKLMESWSKLNS